MARTVSLVCFAALIGLAWSGFASPVVGGEKKKVLDVEMKTLDGKTVNLKKKYQGKVVLVVNVASQCGLTPQYEQLQALHKKYSGKGLVVLGFPCNQFGQQEPGSAEEIKQFCESEYGVQFDMFAKIEVNGKEQCELYRRLTSNEASAKYPGKINWNFEKFVIGRSGEVLARFSPRLRPDDPKLLKTLQKELEKE